MPLDVLPFSELRTSDGGARQGTADLWCTYAAVRTLTWLGEKPADPEKTVRFLSAAQNSDGGFAWQKGLTSDVWATYYSTQALSDLGAEIPHLAELKEWIGTTRDSSGGFAMTPGQRPDVWATYYATRTYAEILGTGIPRPDDLKSWLGSLQRTDGGLGWYPGAGESDVRACYYAATAWRASFGDEPRPWAHPALVGWLDERQTPAGGFVFDESAKADDLWATFRAVRALAALGERPDREADCVDWVISRQPAAGSFTRWDDYPDADVWAAFSAVGALQTLGRTPRDTAAVVAFLQECELPEGGFTYRRAGDAGDSLATAALLLTGTANGGGADRNLDTLDGLARWLHAAHLPYEGGVMYMPGRGAEVRCTLWAVSALAAARREQLDADRLVAWLRLLQNTDGGFGYWHGRASDMVATVSALDILAALGRPADELDTAALRSFADSCRTDTGYRYSPGAAVTAASTAQALRLLHLLDDGRDTDGLRTIAGRLLSPYASRLGGYASQSRGIPDLVSTYQVVLTLQALELPLDGPELSRFLARVRLPDDTFAWSPLGRRGGGPLAGALGTLLTHSSRLPAINL
ncbi:prenyltransferase/squalene oxidase repeat-containing protein [Streptomyces sp. NPDC002680]|uniref:prenyltransferase/squalene oxidase repeat-containing protein n=1 Tax=Streptomyces sp. NPDC002680 TaxID=3364659 RepID=UPI0036C45300